MTAMVFLFISIALIIIGIVLAYKKLPFWAVICIIAADVCIVAPWAEAGSLWGESLGIFTIPQRVLYMIGLESWASPDDGGVVVQALGSLAPLYSVVFMMLSVATPIVAGVIAYSAVTQKLSSGIIHWRMAWHKTFLNDAPLYVFEGLNTRTITYLRSIYERDASQNITMNLAIPKHYLCIVSGVSKDEREKHSGDIEQLRKWSVAFTEQSAYELCNARMNALLGLGELRICFFSEHHTPFGSAESKNVSDAIQVAELLVKNMPANISANYTYEGAPRYHIHVACRGRSDELIFDSIEGSEKLDIHVIDEGREVIYDLLWRHPLYETIVLPPARLLEIATSDTPRSELDAHLARLVVVVFGWGHYGFEAIRACAWSGQVAGARLHIHIVDKRPESEFEARARHLCPGFWQGQPGTKSPTAARRIPLEALSECSALEPDGSLFDYTYHQSDALDFSFERSITAIRDMCLASTSNQSLNADALQLQPYCIIALGDDDINTDAAVNIRRLFLGEGAGPAIEPRIFVDIYDERRHDALRLLTVQSQQRIDFEPFGGIGRIFTEEHIAHSDVSALALNVNASYAYRLEPDSAPSTPETRRQNYIEYNEWQMNRLSSLTNAMAAKQKLWQLGYAIDENATSETTSVANKEFKQLLEHEFIAYCASQDACNGMPIPARDRTAIEALARAEHDRWSVFYLSEGWVSETAEESNRLKAVGLNDLACKRHDSHLLLRHPYICDYDMLPQVAAAMGKGDPRIHDVKFIANLARIITDARGYSGRPYNIIKRL